MPCRPLPARLAVLVALVVAFVAAGAAAAEPPQISAKRAEAQRVLAQIQELDGELGLAIEAYNGATAELDGIRAARRVNAGHLGVARKNLKVAQRVLSQRLNALYKSDAEDSTIGVLLGSNSLGDFLARIDTVNRVATQDSQVLDEIERFKGEVERRGAELKRADRRQQRVVADRASAKQQVEAGLAERQRLLGSIRSEIGRLQAEERARQARLIAEAQARLRAAQLVAQNTIQEQTSTPTPEEAAQTFGVSALTPDGESVPPPARYTGVVAIAMQYLGVPYVWGGASPSQGFDCSGFTMYVYAQVGVTLPHYAASQYELGSPVSRDQLEPGDLVFFNGLGHNGMYIGGDQFIHAPHTGDVVKISSLNDSWYARTWVGARRL